MVFNMDKIENLLKQEGLTIGEINLLNKINYLANEIDRDTRIICQGEWDSQDDMEMLASVREELSKFEKEYASLRPISTVLMLDPVIKAKYDKIQEVDTTSYYHGFQHIKNVVKIMKKFIIAFNIDDVTADKLLTAVIFHDIGRTNVGKDHDKFSADYFTEYMRQDDNALFARISMKDKDISEIKHAILLHEQKENLDKLDDFQLLVNFADKLDVTKERINLNNLLDPSLPSYKFDLFREIYLDVNDLNIIIDDGALVLNFECNDNMTKERLYSIPFMQVVDKLHKELARRYKLEAIVNIFTNLKKVSK